MRKSRGFTIVELLIVIVVIAILAAITVVAYNGVQARSRDSFRDTSASAIRKAIELYRIDNGTFPNPSNCVNAGCYVSNLASYLSPTYVSTVPDDASAPTKQLLYVTNSTYDGYGLYMQYYETKPKCKFLVGNANTAWWNTATPTC